LSHNFFFFEHTSLLQTSPKQKTNSSPGLGAAYAEKQNTIKSMNILSYAIGFYFEANRNKDTSFYVCIELYYAWICCFLCFGCFVLMFRGGFVLENDSIFFYFSYLHKRICDAMFVVLINYVMPSWNYCK
jgi:hypothetical protein